MSYRQMMAQGYRALQRGFVTPMDITAMLDAAEQATNDQERCRAWTNVAIGRLLRKEFLKGEAFEQMLDLNLPDCMELVHHKAAYCYWLYAQGGRGAYWGENKLALKLLTKLRETDTPLFLDLLIMGAAAKNGTDTGVMLRQQALDLAQRLDVRLSFNNANEPKGYIVNPLLVAWQS